MIRNIFSKEDRVFQTGGDYCIKKHKAESGYDAVMAVIYRIETRGGKSR